MEKTQIIEPMFGKEVILTAEGSSEQITKDLLLEAYEHGLKLEKIFNFYDKNSELSLLNKKRSLGVSDDLLFVLKKAIELSKLTSGLYDPSLGKQFLERKSGKDISSLNCSYKDISIQGNKVSLNHPDVLLDLGSIAKGYIGDKIAEFLISQGLNSFIVDARGDLFIQGSHIINIQHPRDKEKFIGSIKSENSGIATSGDYNQFSKSYKNSHILNQKDLCSITIVAPTLAEADGFATALFVIDKKSRESLIKSNPQIKVMTIDNNLNSKYYNGFNELLSRGKK